MPEKDYSLRSFRGGFDKNLTYLVSCLRTKNQFLVDASVPLRQIKPFINRRGLIALFITHSHKDHISYIDEYAKTFPNLVVIIFKSSDKKINGNYIKPVKNGEIVTVGQLSLETIHTPGHCSDSVCYLLDGVIFTGDTLFVGRTGRAISKDSSVKDLYHSVYNKILKLPKNITIYPGHDYGPKMSISIEKNIKISPLLNAGNEKDFLMRMEDYETNRTNGS